jgi:hypothetical protein
MNEEPLEEEEEQESPSGGTPLKIVAGLLISLVVGAGLLFLLQGAVDIDAGADQRLKAKRQQFEEEQQRREKETGGPANAEPKADKPAAGKGSDSR